MANILHLCSCWRLARSYIKKLDIRQKFIIQDNDSDIDILIDKDESIGLLKLANLQNYLSNLIGIRVDLALKKSLRPHISKDILDEVIYV
jgi:predicted nucleotidyltransferase